MVYIVGINFKYVVYFVVLLGLKGRIMNIGVLKGYHKNDSHHIYLGAFQMTKRNIVAIVKTFYVLPITMGMAGEMRKTGLNQNLVVLLCSSVLCEVKLSVWCLVVVDDWLISGFLNVCKVMVCYNVIKWVRKVMYLSVVRIVIVVCRCV